MCVATFSILAVNRLTPRLEEQAGNHAIELGWA